MKFLISLFLINCSSLHTRHDVCQSKRLPVFFVNVERNIDIKHNIEILEQWNKADKEREEQSTKCYRKVIYGK